MTEYGNLKVEATHLTPQQLSNISKLVESGNIQMEFK